MQAQWKNLGSNTDRMELPNGYLYRYRNPQGVVMCFVPAWTPSEELIFYTNSGSKEPNSPALTDWRRDIENAPRDGSYILISLKERHWYDGPQVVYWRTPEAYWWLGEGWSYTNDEIAGWFAIPQADH